MHVLEFLQQPIVSLPKRWDSWRNHDFEAFTGSMFDEFFDTIDQLDDNEFLGNHIKRRKPQAEAMATAVRSALRNYLNGFPHRAYQAIKDALESDVLDEYIRPICATLNRSSMPDALYRLRLGSASSYSKNQMFHVPYHLRHKVATQRYSIPGLPCLYLGGSLYVCWEELKRPDFDAIQMSAFKIVGDSTVSILNFGMRPVFMAAHLDNFPEDYAGETNSSAYLLAYVVCWPLIAASSIFVRDEEAPFKAEYIIPQIVLQWVSEEDRCEGVRYFSVNIDQYYDSHIACANFVFPSKARSDDGICPTLRGRFEMTEPVAWQIASSLSMPASPTGVANFEIELIRGVRTPYVTTMFGGMEAKLAQLEFSQI